LASLCPACDAPVEPVSGFCGSCGIGISACKCGALSEAATAFCGNCGCDLRIAQSIESATPQIAQPSTSPPSAKAVPPPTSRLAPQPPTQNPAPQDRTKLCPRCGMPATLNTARCTQCGHQYRTVFAAPAATTVSTPPAVPKGPTTSPNVAPPVNARPAPSSVPMKDAVRAGDHFECPNCGAVAGAGSVACARCQALFANAVPYLGQTRPSTPQPVVSAYYPPLPPERNPSFAWAVAGLLVAAVAFGGFQVVSGHRAKMAEEQVARQRAELRRQSEERTLKERQPERQSTTREAADLNVLVDCPSCRGIGTCLWCEGTGKRDSRNSSGHYEDCAHCRGSAICSDCQGSGRTSRSNAKAIGEAARQSNEASRQFDKKMFDDQDHNNWADYVK
jgi:hypothetical protein